MLLVILLLYFLQHGSRALKLRDVISGALKVLTGSCVVTSLSTRSTIVRDVVEGLFAHFFSEQQPIYDEDDVHWFLEMANEQHQWQVSSPSINDADLGNVLLREGSSVSPLHQSRCPFSKCDLLSTFKFYLLRILRKGTLDDDSGSVMFYFKENKVILVTRIVNSKLMYSTNYIHFAGT